MHLGVKILTEEEIRESIITRVSSQMTELNGQLLVAVKKVAPRIPNTSFEDLFFEGVLNKGKIRMKKKIINFGLV